MAMQSVFSGQGSAEVVAWAMRKSASSAPWREK
jgi:hypothetical protein